MCTEQKAIGKCVLERYLHSVISLKSLIKDAENRSSYLPPSPITVGVVVVSAAVVVTAAVVVVVVLVVVVSSGQLSTWRSLLRVMNKLTLG